jgi:hypothetical protein
LVIARLASRHDFTARQSDINVDRILIPVLAMFPSRLDQHAAARDAAGERVQLGRLFANARLDLWRMLHLTKADLQG